MNNNEPRKRTGQAKEQTDNRKKLTKRVNSKPEQAEQEASTNNHPKIILQQPEN